MFFSIIPSLDHVMIEEKENIDATTWAFVRKNVAEIVICDESVENLTCPGAQLGKLHIFTLNRSSGEEECLDDEGFLHICQFIKQKICIRSAIERKSNVGEECVRKI